MLRRMASVTCTRSDVFPNGTVVKAYPRSAFHTGQATLPSGSSVAEGTMTSGTVEISGLTAGVEYTLAAEVSGEVRVLGVQAPPATAIVAATGVPEPSLQKLLAASFDPLVMSGTYQLTPAGTLQIARLPIKEQLKITNLLFWLATKGATLTASQNLVGLFAEGTRKLLAQVTPATVVTEMEGTNGSLLTLPLESPVVVGPGSVLVGLTHNGTTAPTLGAGPVATAAKLNAGAATTNSRFATGDTGITTALPNPITASMVAAACPIWVGVT
jgi:hypothetical protein